MNTNIGQTQLEFQLEPLYGTRGLGFHALQANVYVRGRTNPSLGARLLGLTLEIFMQHRGRVVGLLGYFHPIHGGVNISASTGEEHPSLVQLILPLTRAQVLAIEDARKGEDFELLVQYKVVVGPTANRDAATGSTSQDTVRMSQSQWVSILGQLGFGDRILFEIPVPSAATAPNFSKAVQRFRDAQEALRLGKCRDVVMHCGHALESLDTALKDQATVRSIGKERSMTHNLWQRIQKVRAALFNLSHLGRHSDETAEAVEWHSVDATAVITMTAAALRWCSAKAIEEDEAAKPEGR